MGDNLLSLIRILKRNPGEKHLVTIKASILAHKTKHYHHAAPNLNMCNTCDDDVIQKLAEKT